MSKNMRDIIIALDLKLNHKWTDVYNYILQKKKLEDEEKSKLLKNFDTSSVITIIDDDYPSVLKSIQKPPFILYREDIDKINSFIKIVKETNAEVVFGTKKDNDIILNDAIKALEEEILELRKDFGTFATAVQLLNDIRRDDI